MFHRDPEKLEYFENSVKENTDAEIVSARAYHNPTPLRVRMDRTLDKLNKEGLNEKNDDGDDS